MNVHDFYHTQNDNEIRAESDHLQNGVIVNEYTVEWVNLNLAGELINITTAIDNNLDTMQKQELLMDFQQAEEFIFDG